MKHYLIGGKHKTFENCQEMMNYVSELMPKVTEVHELPVEELCPGSPYRDPTKDGFIVARDHISVHCDRLNRHHMRLRALEDYEALPAYVLAQQALDKANTNRVKVRNLTVWTLGMTALLVIGLSLFASHMEQHNSELKQRIEELDRDSRRLAEQVEEIRQ